MPYHGQWCRRSFLKASLLAGFTLFSGQTVWARELLDKGLPLGKLSLLNIHSDERLVVTYRDRSGEYDLRALDELNWLLRCHHTNEVHPIDVRTLEYLNLVDQRFGGSNEIHVISAYRSPAYNELLRQKGRQVAEKSLHLQGRAIDIRIPRVKLAKLHSAARELQLGGVGYYPGNDFVHLDSGAFRMW
ncbi:MAG TPA: DUF882 domain-containing protein [Desulfuromonadales bacterium]|jgi:uncharacterized protein YcbK (DUF882 family)